jgi:hypothetical protein
MGMSSLRIPGICAIGLFLLASCSSKPTPGGISQMQEFNPSTSQWVTSERVVVTQPGQLAKPVVVTDPASASSTSGSTSAASSESSEPTAKPGLLKKTGGALKKPFKWIPGVD